MAGVKSRSRSLGLRRSRDSVSECLGLGLVSKKKNRRSRSCLGLRP